VAPHAAEDDDPNRPSDDEPEAGETRPMSPDEMKRFEESVVQREGEQPEDTATPLRPPITPW
jgi:hypothetical protein